MERLKQIAGSDRHDADAISSPPSCCSQLEMFDRFPFYFLASGMHAFFWLFLVFFLLSLNVRPWLFFFLI